MHSSLTTKLLDSPSQGIGGTGHAWSATSGSVFRTFFIVGMFFFGSTARAEEGLWTLDQAFRPGIAQRIGQNAKFDLRARIQNNVIRFPTGETGVIVSTNGLVATIRNVAVPCLNAASRAGIDRLREGFRSGNSGDLPCPELTVEQLEESTEVTARLRQGLRPTDEVPDERLSSIENECGGRPGIKCRVLSLFDGEKLVLQRFKRHTDVRLVFAPEHRLSAFGNSHAQLIFPSYSLGVAFFRIYENGLPLPTPTPLHVKASGVANKDKVLVVGYPSGTDRYLPWPFLNELVSSGNRQEFEVAREQAKELLLLSREQNETVAQEDTRLGRDKLASRLKNEISIFQNQPFKRKLRAADSEMRNLVERHVPKGAAGAWAAAAMAQDRYKQLYRLYLAIEGERGLPFGRLFDIGRQVLRWCEESGKSEADRFPDYRGEHLSERARRLSEAIPLSGPTEEILIEQGLLRLLRLLPPQHRLTLALGDESPRDMALRIVASTKLGDENLRKAIFATGELGEAAADPLLILVREIESDARPLRKEFEQAVVRELAVYSKVINRALFAEDESGTSRYPNPIQDLRVSSGQVRGFLDFGRNIPSVSTMGGLIVRSARATPGSPWRLPRLWRDKQRRIDLTKPLNFITDADVGGGAPGAAVLNTDGDVVGIIVDSTLKSTVNRYVYRGEDERAVAVHPSGIIESLRQVYGAKKLADEIDRGSLP